MSPTPPVVIFAPFFPGGSGGFRGLLLQLIVPSPRIEPKLVDTRIDDDPHGRPRSLSDPQIQPSTDIPRVPDQFPFVVPRQGGGRFDVQSWDGPLPQVGGEGHPEGFDLLDVVSALLVVLSVVLLLPLVLSVGRRRRGVVHGCVTEQHQHLRLLLLFRGGAGAEVRFVVGTYPEEVVVKPRSPSLAPSLIIFFRRLFVVRVHAIGLPLDSIDEEVDTDVQHPLTNEGEVLGTALHPFHARAHPDAGPVAGPIARPASADVVHGQGVPPLFSSSSGVRAKIPLGAPRNEECGDGTTRSVRIGRALVHLGGAGRLSRSNAAFLPRSVRVDVDIQVEVVVFVESSQVNEELPGRRWGLR
mmetsp:Transcript_54785/g.163916  ORF Transcript_54785/g.163916 Transcript_54785/m.163916 type:complete len:356 (-) Transcript_54785:2109-3176(-)